MARTKRGLFGDQPLTRALFSAHLSLERDTLQIAFIASSMVEKALNEVQNRTGRKRLVLKHHVGMSV